MLISLEKYGISPDNGFLSPHPPLQSFSDPYYAPWDQIATNLHQLIQSEKLEQAVHDLQPLDPHHLDTDVSLQRAYTVLAFLIHGFVWSSSPPRVVIPSQLSEPFLQVCEKVGMRPVISYTGLCLWNWRLRDPEACFDLENMDMIASFTGTRGEAAFYHVPVLIEQIGGRLVSTLLSAVEAVITKHASVDIQVLAALEGTAKTIVEMGDQLSKLYTILDADFFYHELRPFIGGGKGMEEKGLPRGIVFRRSNAEEVEARYAGGSAIQSSLFPFLDHMLGVQHNDAMFKDMRQYMPRVHREFLTEAARLPSLREYVQECEDTEIIEAYNECMKVLQAWRKKHIAVVSKYIVQPARKEAKRAATMDANVRSDSPLDGEDGALQGTGGSALIPFLRQAVAETTKI